MIPSSELAPAPAQPLDGGSREQVKIARRLANEGRLTDALAACDRALTTDKLSASCHYLRGVIAQEQGSIDEAVSSLRRALFIEPDFIVAHFALGLLLQRLGRESEAARSLTNARALLRQCDPAATLPESDGVTAGRMLAILSAMPHAAP